jgi:hypothetical protein
MQNGETQKSGIVGTETFVVYGLVKSFKEWEKVGLIKINVSCLLHNENISPKKHDL